MIYKLADIKRWVAAGARVRLKCGATVRLNRRSPTPEEHEAFAVTLLALKKEPAGD
jgi:hypothetical protein